ncbi:PTB domain engulfment adapter [Carex rostrata]
MPISSLSLLCSSFSFSKDSPINISPTKDAVYVAAVPLRAAPGPAQILLSTAYNFNFGYRHLRHYVVLIKSSHHDQVLLFDFQPKDSENIFAALAVISQRKLPGVILNREIRRIPRTRCWFVGFSKGNSVEIANRFNQNWSTDLVVGTNDCRHYTNGLVESLTGEENVLENLKN